MGAFQRTPYDRPGWNGDEVRIQRNYTGLPARTDLPGADELTKETKSLRPTSNPAPHRRSWSEVSKGAKVPRDNRPGPLLGLSRPRPVWVSAVGSVSV